jgi:hypothetical protein
MTGFFLPTYLREGVKQGTFAESRVRYLYLLPLSRWIFHSRYVWFQKSLKASVKLDTSELVFFCRLIPISLWLGSLLAVTQGGALCQLGND